MAFTSTSAVLTALKTRIEALLPTTRANDDDRYRVEIDTARTSATGSRHVLLDATGAIRKPNSSRTCVDWFTTVDLTVFYRDVPVEAGERTALQLALEDAEDLLADLYVWSVTTDGILSFDPDEAQAKDTGEGEIEVTRTLRISFQRA